MREAPFSIKESLIFGWHAFKAHHRVFIPVVGLMVAISLVSQFVGGHDDTIVTGIALVLATVAQIIIGMGIVKLSLKAAMGLPIAFDDIFSVSHLFFSYIGAALLYGLIVLGGFLLLIVPGIIWLITYWLFQYALVDKELGALAALAEAKRISKSVKLPLFIFMVVTGALNLAGAVLLIVGLVITIPVTALATAHVYGILQKQNSAKEPEEVKKPEPNNKENVLPASVADASPIHTEQNS
jgi:hypothetical protein